MKQTLMLFLLAVTMVVSAGQVMLGGKVITENCKGIVIKNGERVYCGGESDQAPPALEPKAAKTRVLPVRPADGGETVRGAMAAICQKFKVPEVPRTTAIDLRKLETIDSPCGVNAIKTEADEKAFYQTALNYCKEHGRAYLGGYVVAPASIESRAILQDGACVLGNVRVEGPIIVGKGAILIGTEAGEPLVIRGNVQPALNVASGSLRYGSGVTSRREDFIGTWGPRIRPSTEERFQFPGDRAGNPFDPKNHFVEPSPTK